MLLLSIFVLLSVPIGLLLYNELIGYLKILNYRRQGIKRARYMPLPILVNKVVKSFFSDDFMSYRKKKMVD